MAFLPTFGRPWLSRGLLLLALISCMNALECFISMPCTEHELRAEDLRIAAQAIGHITGRVDVEDVLGEIFARFCIGK